MNEWWRHLTGRPFYWVLDSTHPAADLFVLRHVVERPACAPGLRAARLALAESSQVARLRAHLDGAGGGLWSPRYGATLWALRLLAELGVPGNDEGVAEALDRVLDQPPGPEEESEPLNLAAIVLHTAMAFGFHDDERVRAGVARVQGLLRTDALPVPGEARADWLVQMAMALAEQPEAERDGATLALLQTQLERLDPATLERYACYTFPTFDRPDDLTLARSALRLGLGGAWLVPWVQRIEAAQDERGLWRLQRALPTPGGVRWEDEGAPSRWVSAQAMYVLRAFYGE